jgi:hippurate hydrolase
MPHLSIDPTLAAAHVVVALQSIVARTIDPLEPAVVSVCGLRSETDTYNVIADSVTLKGTFRSFNAQVRETLIARIKEITTSTARAHGTDAEVTFHPGVGPTINAVEPAGHAAEAARTVAGAVIDSYPPVTGGEDFSDMLAQRPGAYLFLGNGASAGLHHPEYEFNDEAIPTGCSWFATLAEQRMPLA